MVKHVKINGKSYPLLWGWNAIRKFSQETEIELFNIEITLIRRIDYLFVAIYIAICEGYRKEGTGCNLTIDDLGDEFNEDPKAVKVVLKTLLEQMKMTLPGDNDDDDNQPGEKKKKKPKV